MVSHNLYFKGLKMGNSVILHMQKSHELFVTSFSIQVNNSIDNRVQSETQVLI